MNISSTRPINSEMKVKGDDSNDCFVSQSIFSPQTARQPASTGNQYKSFFASSFLRDFYLP